MINVAAFAGDCRAAKSFLKTCVILQQFVDFIAGAGEEEEEVSVLQGTADLLLWLCHLSERPISITYFVLLQIAADQCMVRALRTKATNRILLQPACTAGY